MGTAVNTHSNRQKLQAAGPVRSRVHEIVGLLALAGSLVTLLSVVSYDPSGTGSFTGALGWFFSDLMIAGLGIVAFAIPLELALLTWSSFRKQRLADLGHVAAVLTWALTLTSLAHLLGDGFLIYGHYNLGGAVGELGGEVLRALVGYWGGLIVCFTVSLVTLVIRTNLSVEELSVKIVSGWRRSLQLLGTWMAEWRAAFRKAKDLESEQDAFLAPKVVALDLVDGHTLEDAPMSDDLIARVSGLEVPTSAKPNTAVQKTTGQKKAGQKELANPPEVMGDDFDSSDADDNSPPASEESEAAAQVIKLSDLHPQSESVSAGGKAANKNGKNALARIVTNQAVTAPVEVTSDVSVAIVSSKGRSSLQPQNFRLPPTTLLDLPVKEQIKIDEKQLRENAERLVDKLSAYGVRGRVDEIHPGPVVTMYEFEPESGTKVAKIASLADDLAMALAAQKVRIVAPIPGKARVGFELPNKTRQSVSVREILEDSRWHESNAALPLAFGKDIAGAPVYGDLAKMPHLLVAGATGAGKSVGLNVMLASLLMRRTPEEVRFLMIDPKVVELAVFDGIPHMLLPVVTDMKKAAIALRWAVDEMERRYQLFADAGARNITTYNERVEKVHKGELSIEKLCPKKAGKVFAKGPQGELQYLDPVDGEAPDEPEMPNKLPYIVVVVDEFADLMMVAARDVESAIARLAQKARAAGIHVILATQRPSVDVITGMIKANFPARIAFKVSQREDSKTILGRIGAEHLLGNGDMLMIPPGASDLKRVHSAFISENEVASVCEFLRAQGTPVYDERILEAKEEDELDGFGGGAGSNAEDPLYDRAVAVVSTAGYCSISHIQRQLSVGYNKAAKLVEQMEKEGVVGPASAKAGGRREVLVQSPI